jgi:hypothetical protein
MLKIAVEGTDGETKAQRRAIVPKAIKEITT